MAEGPIRMRAAVLWAVGRAPEVVEVELAPPKAGEVLVRVAASGVCASDLHVVEGRLPEPLPLVPGHEAAGVVVAVGPDVGRVGVGDHVVLTILSSCGACPSCRRGRPNFCQRAVAMAASGCLADGTSRLSLNGRRLHHFNAVSSFAEYAVVPASAVVPIPAEVPLESAALIGCAVLTGFGAVVNTAAVPAGASVAVFGCGGVGLHCVQAARLVGATPIVAVDVQPARLELARRLGATHLVDASRQDPVAAVRAATGGGAAYVFEALGSEETIGQAWEATEVGGTTVVVGIVPRGRLIRLDPWNFMSEKVLRGCYLGSADIVRDVPRLVELYRRDRLRLDELVTARLPLTRVGEALDRLRAGEGVRSVIVPDGADVVPASPGPGGLREPGPGDRDAGPARR
ncbi:MAG TPA: Zn-dependent alcohol dehydrogenase [Candidatus Dormibacteraeota bacterium]|nr:Zn-dependent alcohol dehydrogenase [Candidatus Dormibacteraeota bacterium]